MSRASNVPAEEPEGSTMAGFAWLAAAASLTWVFAEASKAAVDPTPLDTDRGVLWEMTVWSGLGAVVAIHVARNPHDTPGPSWPVVLSAVGLVVLGAIRFAPTSNIVLLSVMWAAAGGAIQFVESSLRTAAGARPSIPEMFEPTGSLPREPEPTAMADPIATAGSPVACPFLGLPDDAATHFMFAAPGHRCYAGSRPTKIGLPHQGSFCLSEGFRACARFPATAMATATAGVTGAAIGQDHDRAILTSPIRRLRGARPGGYVPPLANISPGKGGTTGRRRDGRAWVRPVIAVVIVGMLLAGAAWAIAGRGGVIAG